LLEAGEESFDRLYAINLKGPFFLTQRMAKQMLAQEADAEGFRGRVVNVTSISAYTASTSRGDYCMLKAGLAMMTTLFADRLAADGINVYEIRPGIIATDMTSAVKEKYDQLILRDERGITPIRRWGRPEDIGRAVRAIAEDRFPFSTGAVFDVDGGFQTRAAQPRFFSPARGAAACRCTHLPNAWLPCIRTATKRSVERSPNLDAGVYW